MIGEGNGNPLQYSCLENPVDRGAWWAAVHRVAQSRTQLKRLRKKNHKKRKLQKNITYEDRLKNPQQNSNKLHLVTHP